MQHRKSMIGLAAALAIVLSAASPAAAANWHGHGGGWHGGGGGWHGGGGGWRGGGWRRGAGWGGAAAGFAAGALIGSAAAAPYGYGYGYGPYAYDNGYYGDDAYAAEPATTDDGGDQYCAQRYRSYDPSSGTFLGYDGMRHPCP